MTQRHACVHRLIDFVWNTYIDELGVPQFVFVMAELLGSLG